MSKPKNRIMCPDCGKSKMLFETEAKANNFIKFNSEEFENGDELRVYYCPACCGWHITHQKIHQNMFNRTEEMIKAYNSLFKKHDTEECKQLIDEFYNILVKLNLKSRKAVNNEINKPEYNKYDTFVKQEAKTRYYFENEIGKEPYKKTKKKK
jgi:hypothetical protein